MNTTLIIGSGVSIYSKIPGVEKITESILTSDKIGKGTDTNYYFEGYLGYVIQDHSSGYVTECHVRLVIYHNRLLFDRIHQAYEVFQLLYIYLNIKMS